MILFLIPYVPIPRMMKRIVLASTVCNPVVIYWDRGTDNADKLNFPPNVKVIPIYEKANEGSPLKRLKATMNFCKKVYSILKEEKPQCLHVTKTDMLLLAWIYLKFNRLRINLIYEISDMHKLALNSSKKIKDILIKKVIAFVEKIGCNRVDYLIVTAEAFWKEYYKKWIDKDKVIFIPNTPEPSVFSNYKKKSTGKLTVGFIGKVRYVTQLKMLIDASKVADVDVLIAGNGIGLNEILNYSKGLKNVKVIGEYDYTSDIANLYSQVDCIYSVYDTELRNVQIALPNRLYEAAFCQIPLIVSSGTELAEIVEREKIGIAINDGDLNNLVQTLDQLKKNISNDIYSANCKRFSLKHDYRLVSEKLKEVYNKC